MCGMRILREHCSPWGILLERKYSEILTMRG